MRLIRNTAVVLSLLCALFPALARAKAPAPRTFSTVNLMPDFWRFWEKAKALPADQQYPLFQRMVMARHPEVYNEEVLGNWSDLPFDQVFPDRFAKMMKERIRPHLATIRRLSDEIATELPKQDRRFRRAFPDMAYHGKIYFLASIMAFDGATREVNGKEALLFGVDTIAAIYGEKADLSPLFTHELFHLYHSQFLPESADPKVRDPLWVSLWREGLAVYVTEQLNPGADQLALFGLPTNTPERARAELPKLAALLRSKLQSTRKDDYAAFFLGGMKREANPPARSGYYVGYLVAKQLAHGKTLRKLAHWHGPTLEKAISAALERLEKAEPAR